MISIKINIIIGTTIFVVFYLKIEYKRNGGIVMKKLREESGITLIALIITIIVLLILARRKYFNGCWRKWNFKYNAC